MSVFNDISKHAEVRQKYSATRLFFSTLFSVFGNKAIHGHSYLTSCMTLGEYLEKCTPGTELVRCHGLGRSL